MAKLTVTIPSGSGSTYTEFDKNFDGAVRYDNTDGYLTIIKTVEGETSEDIDVATFAAGAWLRVVRDDLA